MLRRFALLPIVSSLLAALLAAQPPAWKEFSIGPATRKLDVHTNNIRQGVLHSNSISLKSLIAVATGVPTLRLLAPDWIESAHFAVAATLSDETYFRLRTRAPDDARVVDEFRSLLTQELVHRFRLEFHRETRDTPEYTLQRAEGLAVNLRPSIEREPGRIIFTNPALSRDNTLDAGSVPFRTIGTWLQSYLEAPVTVDPSLPAGVYDFHLKWQTGNQPSLFAALKNQLGVELVKETRRQEYVVVDQVERPDTPVTPDPPPPAEPALAAPDSSLTFTPAELRRDLRILREALQEGHPGIYRYTPKAELDRVFDGAAAQLTRPMTALEFYRVLAPAVAQVKCGHTVLQPSRAIHLRLASEPLLPVETALLGGKVYVARDLTESAQSAGAQSAGAQPAGAPLPGAEILSINGIPISRILASTLAVVHGDGDSPTAGPYQLSHNRGFARNLYLIAGLQSPFTLRYAISGKIAETSLIGMPMKAVRDPQAEPAAGNATWRLLEDGSIGVLKITAFAGKAQGDVPMSAFFQRVFTELREKSVSKLILDVRDNGGGEDELGRELFSYFADQPFRYYHDLIVNKLAFRFFQYAPNREPLPANVHELVKLGADRKYHVVGHPNWGTHPPAAPHFGGKVVVLMNGGSFSTTCEFLSILHNHGGATFVGEETAGGYYGNTSGTGVSLVLPNSKLILPVHLVDYYMAIDGSIDGTAHRARGIRPDHPVSSSIEDVLAGRDRPMDMALRLLMGRL